VTNNIEASKANHDSGWAHASDHGVSVQLIDLRKEYGSAKQNPFVALDNISYTFPAGSITSVVGSSGSGKSTMLNLIGGIDTATSGTIRVGALDITKLSRRRLENYRSTIGYVFQRFHLIPSMSALDYVAMPLVGKFNKKQRQIKALEALEQVGLGDRTKSFPWQLSGGQQQRVAIAPSIRTSPRLLLADEPTGNLDKATTTSVLSCLRDLQQNLGMTMIISTHDAEVASIAPTTIQIEDGSLILAPNGAAAAK